MLMTAAVTLTVSAGDENNPEFTDSEADVLLFGQYPLRIINRLFTHIDIVSAWFHENPDEPDVLFATIKLQNIKQFRLMGGYGVAWNHNGTNYVAITLISRGEENLSGLQIHETSFIPIANFFTINEAEKTITFAIPKDLAGDLGPGDIVESQFALSVVRFVSDTLANLLQKRFGTNLLAYDLSEHAIDYTIQY